jgi:hypothetical protein
MTVASVCLTGSVDALAAKKIKLQRAQVVIEHIEVVRGPAGGTPFSGINPCCKVPRTLFEQAQAGAPISLKFQFKYLSGGNKSVKTAFVALKSMQIARHHPTDDPKFVFLGTSVNVTRKPVDANTSVTGAVRVKKNTPRKKS